MAKKTSKSVQPESLSTSSSERYRTHERREQAYQQKLKKDEERLRNNEELALKRRIAETIETFTPDEKRTYQAGMKKLKKFSWSPPSVSLKNSSISLKDSSVSLKDEWDLISKIKDLDIEKLGKFREELELFFKLPSVKKPPKLNSRARKPLSDSEEAKKTAAALEGKHGVKVKYVPTKEELFSEALIEKSISEDAYYFSVEDLKNSAEYTDYLIRYDKARKAHEVGKLRERKLELLTIAHEVQTERSNQTAQDVRPAINSIIESYRAENAGDTPSFHKIASALNEQKIPTPRGQDKWFAQTVKRVLERVVNVNQK